MRCRKAFTLIELLIVVFILGLAIALLLGAVQKVRTAAAMTQLQNNLRQQAIAYQNRSTYKDKHRNRTGAGVFMELTKYYEPSISLIKEPHGNNHRGVIKELLNPADPSYRAPYTNNDLYNIGFTSLAVNGTLFRKAAMTSAISDGQSNTILFTERYANCEVGLNEQGDGQICFMDHETHRTQIPCEYWISRDRNATFADMTYREDVIPELLPNRRSGASLGTVTFQSHPLVQDCNTRYPESSSPGRLYVAMADGSVRGISSSVDHTIFWSAVTPSENEPVAGLD